MNAVTKPSPQVKLEADTSGERDLMLSAIRVAATRSRLLTNIFDSVGVALRQKAINCAGALAWLKDEGLLDHLPSFNAAEQNWSSPGWKKAAADYHAERRDEAAK